MCTRRKKPMKSPNVFQFFPHCVSQRLVRSFTVYWTFAMQDSTHFFRVAFHRVWWLRIRVTKILQNTNFMSSPVNSNTADCIYWRTDFCISHYSWTREKRLQANQLFSSNISMFQFRKEFLMFMNIHHQY